MGHSNLILDAEHKIAIYYLKIDQQTGSLNLLGYKAYIQARSLVRNLKVA